MAAWRAVRPCFPGKVAATGSAVGAFSGPEMVPAAAAGGRHHLPFWPGLGLVLLVLACAWFVLLR
jgi:hypothetical protein